MTEVATLPNLKNSPISSPVLKKYAVVILNRYPKLAEKFIASIRATHEVMPSIVVVRDRNNATFGDGVKVIDGHEPFVYAHNSNLGIQYFSDRDVFLCNDDLQCVEQDFFPTLHAIATAYPRCGLISPLIKGGVGMDIQNYYKREQEWAKFPNEIRTDGIVCFPCVLLKRKTLRRVGLLDENFTGYGMDDTDYCIRTRKAGFWTMITRQLHIQHGDGEEGLNCGRNYSLSFAREPIRKSNYEYFLTKHPQPEQAFITKQRPTGIIPRRLLEV